jgi:hypothetical protein
MILKDFTLDRGLQLPGQRWHMKKGLLVLAAAVMTLAPIGASAAIRGGFVVAAPGFYGGFYAPYWGSYWGPGYVGPYYAYPNSGEVKLDTKVKTAQVFINGSYAGTTHENKTMRLRPGSYNIEIREGGQTPFAQQVYVAAGKTLHLHPEL